MSFTEVSAYETMTWTKNFLGGNHGNTISWIVTLLSRMVSKPAALATSRRHLQWQIFTSISLIAASPSRRPSRHASYHHSVARAYPPSYLHRQNHPSHDHVHHQSVSRAYPPSYTDGEINGGRGLTSTDQGHLIQMFVCQTQRLQVRDRHSSAEGLTAQYCMIQIVN